MNDKLTLNEDFDISGADEAADVLGYDPDAEPTLEDQGWEYVASKDVYDEDGFRDSYMWYRKDGNNRFFFSSDAVYGDPEYFDWETEGDEAAQEWFDSYGEDEDELTFVDNRENAILGKGDDPGFDEYDKVDEAVEERIVSVPEKNNLIKAIKQFVENGRLAKRGSWSIANGGYDLAFEIYFNGNPIAGGMYPGYGKTEVRVYNNSYVDDAGIDKKELGNIVCDTYGDCKIINEAVEDNLTAKAEIDTPRGTFYAYKGTWKDFENEDDRDDWGFWFDHYTDDNKHYKIMHNHIDNSAIAVLKEGLNESKRGFVEKYRGYSIHDAGDRYVITNENGLNVGETRFGIPVCHGMIDDMIDGKEADKITEAKRTKFPRGFNLGSSNNQNVKVRNPYNYTIQELSINNKAKTFERGNFSMGRADIELKNRQEYEDIVDLLKDQGYTEVRSDYHSLRNKTRKGIREDKQVDRVGKEEARKVFDKGGQVYISNGGKNYWGYDKSSGTTLDDVIKNYYDNQKNLSFMVDHRPLTKDHLLNRIKERRKTIEEDTVKQNGKWVNKGKEGTHGKFNTKKEADAQRKAMFAQGFTEDLDSKSVVGKDYSEIKKKLYRNGYREDKENFFVEDGKAVYTWWKGKRDFINVFVEDGIIVQVSGKLNLKESLDNAEKATKEDILEYAKLHGDRSAADLLLLGGYEFFDGTADEYDALLKELESKADGLKEAQVNGLPKYMQGDYELHQAKKEFGLYDYDNPRNKIEKLASELEKKLFVSSAEVKDNNTIDVKTAWRTTPRRVHSDYEDVGAFISKKLGKNTVKWEGTDYRDDGKEKRSILEITIPNSYIKESKNESLYNVKTVDKADSEKVDEAYGDDIKTISYKGKDIPVRSGEWQDVQNAHLFDKVDTVTIDKHVWNVCKDKDTNEIFALASADTVDESKDDYIRRYYVEFADENDNNRTHWTTVTAGSKAEARKIVANHGYKATRVSEMDSNDNPIDESFNNSSSSYYLTTVCDMIDGSVGNVDDEDIDKDLKFWRTVARTFNFVPGADNVAVLIADGDYDPEYYYPSWTNKPRAIAKKYPNAVFYDIPFFCVKEVKNGKMFLYFDSEESAKKYVDLIDSGMDLEDQDAYTERAEKITGGELKEDLTPENGEETFVASNIITAIEDEWKTISLYNNIITMLSNESDDKYKDIIPVIQDIVEEENVHVGQLQKALETISPDTAKIQSGEVEADGQLQKGEEEESGEPTVESLKESLDDDDIDTESERWEDIYEYGDDSDEYDDFELAGIYGGDLTYCPICGRRLEYDEDGDSFCPKCEKSAWELSQERRKLDKERKNESVEENPDDDIEGTEWYSTDIKEIPYGKNKKRIKNRKLVDVDKEPVRNPVNEGLEDSKENAALIRAALESGSLDRDAFIDYVLTNTPDEMLSGAVNFIGTSNFDTEDDLDFLGDGVDVTDSFANDLFIDEDTLEDGSVITLKDYSNGDTTALQNDDNSTITMVQNDSEPACDDCDDLPDGVDITLVDVDDDKPLEEEKPLQEMGPLAATLLTAVAPVVADKVMDKVLPEEKEDENKVDDEVYGNANDDDVDIKGI